MSTRKVEIHKAKVKKRELLQLSYSEKGEKGAMAEHDKVTFGNLVEDSLLAAFDGMRIHFGLLSGQFTKKHIKSVVEADASLLEPYTVTGITLKGEKEDRGIIVTGVRRLLNGKTITINTPVTRYEDQSDNAYEFSEELEEQADLIVKEVIRYMEGHFKPDPQLSLDIPEAGAKIKQMPKKEPVHPNDANGKKEKIK